jgi:ABC-type multidrug transport system ATPase subunit
MTRIGFKEVSFGYGKAPIFQKLSFGLDGTDHGPGHIVAVIGASGSGKTTLLRLIAGLERPREGRVEVSKGAHVGFLFQRPVIFEHLSVRSNARYYERLRHTKNRFSPELFDSLSRALGLTELANSDRSPTTLSGGERQRLALLRETSIAPPILLLDEPCAGLDISSRNEFASQLRVLTDRLGLLVLYVTHHFEEASLVADSVLYVSRRGTVSDVSIGRLNDFLYCPPSLESAQLLHLPVTNTVSCVHQHEAAVRIGSQSYLVEPMPALVQNSSLIAFDPATIRWSGRVGFRALKVGAAELHDIICIEELGTRWVAPKMQPGLTSAELAGPAFFFLSPESPGFRVTVSPSTSS